MGRPGRVPARPIGHGQRMTDPVTIQPTRLQPRRRRRAERPRPPAGMPGSRVRPGAVLVTLALVALTVALGFVLRQARAAEARAEALAVELQATREEVAELRGRVATLEEEQGVGSLDTADIQRLIEEFLAERGLDDLGDLGDLGNLGNLDDLGDLGDLLPSDLEELRDRLPSDLEELGDRLGLPRG